MCLNVKKDAKICIAKKPITVYKCLLTGTNQSPYMHFPYKRGKKYSMRGKLRVRVYDIRQTTQYVEDGFHAYTNKRRTHYYPGRKLCKFTIPAGATYIRGTFIGLPSIVSDQIVATSLKDIRNVCSKK